MIDRLEISGHSPRLPNCRQNHRELRPSDLRVIFKNIALAFDYFSEVWLYKTTLQTEQIALRTSK